MQYRTFPKIPEKQISSLCFSLSPASILKIKNNALLVQELLETALNSGINCLDLRNFTQSANEANSFRCMESVQSFLQKNSNVLYVQSAVNIDKDLAKKPFESILKADLDFFKITHFGFYCVNILSSDAWKSLNKENFYNDLKKALKENKIKHLGFSFQGDFVTFKEICDSFNWDFVELVFNYLESEERKEEMRYARLRQIGVQSLSPFKEGKLSEDAHDKIKAIWAEYAKPRMNAEWALRYVLDREEIVTVKFSSTNISHIWENIAVSLGAHYNSITDKERALIEKVRKSLLV